MHYWKNILGAKDGTHELVHNSLNSNKKTQLAAPGGFGRPQMFKDHEPICLPDVWVDHK